MSASVASRGLPGVHTSANASLASGSRSASVALHLGDGGGIAQIERELANSGNCGVAHLLEIAGMGIRNTEGRGDVAVLFARVILVVLQNGGQQNTVGNAVSNAQTPTERVRHAVHEAQPNVRVGHAVDVAW